MEPIYKRITDLRTHLKLNQSQFAKRIDVTSQLINKIESGSTKLTEEKIRLICHEFKVNEEWLRDGKGEMMDDEAALSGKEKQLLAFYRELSPQAQELLTASVEGMIKLQESQKGG